MTKNDLVTIIINSKSINATLDKIDIEYRQDFKQHFYLQLLEKEFDKLLEVHSRGEGALEAFAGAIIKNQLKSNNSSFHKVFRKHTVANAIDPEILFDVEVVPDYFEKNYNNIISFLNHLHPKKSKLFIEHYINGKSITEISTQYGIKYRTVHASIRTTEKLIKNNLDFESE